MLPILNLPPKTVNEIRTYGINWGARFQSGEYITSSVWNVPNGLEVRSVGLSQEYSSVALITVAGGLARKKYRIINRISTSTGQLLEIAANLEVHSYA